MMPLAGLDLTSLAALAALIVSAAGAVTGGFIGRKKGAAETESIATKTTLEVNEALREELIANRKEATFLRETLRQRDEELENLQRRFSDLRREFDVLESELNALRDARAGA